MLNMLVRYQDKYAFSPINNRQAPSSQFLSQINTKKYNVEEYNFSHACIIIDFKYEPMSVKFFKYYK